MCYGGVYKICKGTSYLQILVFHVFEAFLIRVKKLKFFSLTREEVLREMVWREWRSWIPYSNQIVYRSCWRQPYTRGKCFPVIFWLGGRFCKRNSSVKVQVECLVFFINWVAIKTQSVKRLKQINYHFLILDIIN